MPISLALKADGVDVAEHAVDLLCMSICSRRFGCMLVIFTLEQSILATCRRPGTA